MPALMIGGKLKLAMCKARAFVADQRGVSAVEFAFILPLMVTLYMGGVEVTQAVSASRKATLVSRTVADLVTQLSSISNTDMTNVLNASSAVMVPFASGGLTVVVSSIKIDNTGTGKVAWSDTLNGTPRSVNQTITLDSALAVPNTSLILGEVTYVYTPIFGTAITGQINLSERIYMRPRVSACVVRPPTVTAC